MPRATKATNGQYLIRIKEVEKMIVDGESRANILENIKRKYGVSDAQIGYYVTAAYKRITSINKATIDEHKGWVLRNHLEVIKMARAQDPPNLSEIRLNLVEIAKILGLNQGTFTHMFERLDNPDSELDAVIEAECQEVH